jgi:hypothetical protein
MSLKLYLIIQSIELTCGKPLKCRESAAILTDYAILCSSGLILINSYLKPVCPQNVNVLEDLWFNLALSQIQLGPLWE